MPAVRSKIIRVRETVFLERTEPYWSMNYKGQPCSKKHILIHILNRFSHRL